MKCKATVTINCRTAALQQTVRQRTKRCCSCRQILADSSVERGALNVTFAKEVASWRRHQCWQWLMKFQVSEISSKIVSIFLQQTHPKCYHALFSPSQRHGLSSVGGGQDIRWRPWSQRPTLAIRAGYQPCTDCFKIGFHVLVRAIQFIGLCVLPICAK